MSSEISSRLWSRDISTEVLVNLFLILFSSSSSCRSVHLLQLFSRALLSEDQGYYSCSSEACQDHQKLNSLTPFPSFTTQSMNSIPQIIIHPKNMQFMEHLAFILLPWILQLAIFEIEDQWAWSDLSLLLAFRFTLSSFVGAFYRQLWAFPNPNLIHHIYVPCKVSYDSAIHCE